MTKLRIFFKAYETILHRYPIAFTTLQTGILVGAGDVLAQTIVERKTLKTFNYTRTFEFFCVGAVYLGPTLSVWYRVLDKLIGHGGKYYGLKKTAIDQFCFAPIGIGGFLFTANAFQGKTFEEIKQTFNNIYWEILMANYKLWPAVQIVNFTFVPLHYQVLFVQIFALIWNTYVCYKTKHDES